MSDCKWCKYSVILVIINFLFLMTGISSSGILRFTSTVSFLFNIFVWFLLLVHGKIKRSTVGNVIWIWTLFVVFQTLMIPNNTVGRLMTLLESFYWVSFYFICMHWFSMIRWTDSKRDIWVLRVFFLFAAVTLYVMLTRGDKYNDNGVLIAKNVIFFPVFLTPWLTLIRNPKKKWIALGVLVLLAFFSLKRSALIIVLVGVALAFIDRGYVKGVKRASSNVFAIVLLLSIIGFLHFSPYSPLSDMQSRFENIDSDEGNGRMDIYGLVLFKFDQLSLENKVFGAGYKKVQYDLTGGNLDSSLSAHNDFVEVLYDYGYVGESLYILLFFTILFRAIKYKREGKWYAIPAFVGFFLFLIICLFSNLIIYPTYFLFLSAFWAFCENQYRLKQ